MLCLHKLSVKCVCNIVYNHALFIKLNFIKLHPLKWTKLKPQNPIPKWIMCKINEIKINCFFLVLKLKELTFVMFYNINQTYHMGSILVKVQHLCCFLKLEQPEIYKLHQLINVVNYKWYPWWIILYMSLLVLNIINISIN